MFQKMNSASSCPQGRRSNIANFRRGGGREIRRPAMVIQKPCTTRRFVIERDKSFVASSTATLSDLCFPTRSAIFNALKSATIRYPLPRIDDRDS